MVTSVGSRGTWVAAAPFDPTGRRGWAGRKNQRPPVAILWRESQLLWRPTLSGTPRSQKKAYSWPRSMVATLASSGAAAGVPERTSMSAVADTRMASRVASAPST